ncbi:MAG: rhodanese-like domain-containing protein [Sphingobacteriaceae bacterium]|nr:rhodanese-like domain-containing protein [Sphingobacteriaceae bacterium]
MAYENLYSPEFRAALSADPNGVLLDVRTAPEVAERRIPGSLHLDVMQPDFSVNALELDPTKNYFVYCRSGGRSAQACMILEESGFTGRLVNLMGGITGYDGPTE